MALQGLLCARISLPCSYAGCIQTLLNEIISSLNTAWRSREKKPVIQYAHTNLGLSSSPPTYTPRQGLIWRLLVRNIVSDRGSLNHHKYSMLLGAQTISSSQPIQPTASELFPG